MKVSKGTKRDEDRGVEKHYQRSKEREMNRWVQDHFLYKNNERKGQDYIEKKIS